MDRPAYRHTASLAHRTRALTVMLLAVVTTQAPAKEMLGTSDATGKRIGVIAGLLAESLAASTERRPPRVDLAPESPVRTARNGVHLVIVKDGLVLGDAVARQATLVGNIRVASARAAEILRDTPLAEATVLLTIFFDEEPVEGVPPVPMLLRHMAVLGVHGFSVEYRGAQTFMPPLTPLLQDYNWEETVSALASKVSPPPEGANLSKTKETNRLLHVVKSGKFRLSLVPGLTIALAPGHDRPLILYRLGRLVRITDVTQEAIAKALARAESWYRANQKEDGSFPYQYNPVTQEESLNGLLARHVMNLMALGELWQYTKKEETRTIGIRALGNALKKWYVEDPKFGFGYLTQGQEGAPLGASAAGLLGIVKLRAYRDSKEMKNRAERLVAFIKALRHADGRYDLKYPSDDSLLNIDYYPGEAQLALMEWAREVNDESIVELCLESMRYYQEYFWKTMNTPFIPWHTQACAHIYTATRRQEVAEYILRMNALLITAQQIRQTGRKILPADSPGHFINPKKTRSAKEHVTTTGVYLEGLADAFSLARETGDKENLKQFRDALLWGTRSLLQVQIKDEIDMLIMPNRKRALGGFRTRTDNPRIRIDNMQHAVSALIKIHRVLREEDYQATATLARE